MYKYDYFDKDVLIRDIGECPEILHKGDECWSQLTPRPDYKDESYCRAIYLGQGCWERLRSIDEAEALEILREWGYDGNPPSEK